MISKEDIAKLAELSRIELTDEEAISLQKDISNILDYIGQINALEGNVATNIPLNHNVMRDDIPYEDSNQLRESRGAVVQAFPKQENGYNVVRKIIQKDE